MASTRNNSEPISVTVSDEQAESHENVLFEHLKNGVSEEVAWKNVRDFILKSKCYQDFTVVDNKENRTILHYACERRSKTAAYEFVKYVLDCKMVDLFNLESQSQTDEVLEKLENEFDKVLRGFVDVVDKNNKTALHIAAERKNRRLVELLIEKGADVNLPKNGVDKEAIHYIYDYVPKVISDLFDKNLKVQEDEGGPSKELWDLKYDYTPITGILPYDGSEENELQIPDVKCQTRLLSYILWQKKPTQTDVILHPLVQLFMYEKHKKFFMFIVISILFHVFWSTLSIIFIVKNGRFPGANNTIIDSNDLNTTSDNSTTTGSSGMSGWTPFYIIYVVFFAVAFLKEVTEIYYSPNKWYYLYQLENWGQTILLGIILTLLLDLSTVVTIKNEIVTYLSGIAIFISALLFLGQMNKVKCYHLGQYLEMYIAVFKKLTLLLLIFSPLIGAFVLLFPLLMPNHDDFDTPYFPKIIAMMVGELEYNGIFHGEKDDPVPPFPIFTKLLVLCFVVSVVIVLSNLLIALTLSDVQDLELKARENDLAKYLEQIYLIEKFLLSSRMKCVLKFLCLEQSLRHILVEPNGRLSTQPRSKSFILYLEAFLLGVYRRFRVLVCKNAPHNPIALQYADGEDTTEMTALPTGTPRTRSVVDSAISGSPADKADGAATLKINLQLPNPNKDESKDPLLNKPVHGEQILGRGEFYTPKTFGDLPKPLQEMILKGVEEGRFQKLTSDGKVIEVKTQNESLLDEIMRRVKKIEERLDKLDRK